MPRRRPEPRRTQRAQRGISLRAQRSLRLSVFVIAPTLLRALRPLRSIVGHIGRCASGAVQLRRPAAAAGRDRGQPRRPHLRRRARPEHRAGRADARSGGRGAALGGARETAGREVHGQRRRPAADAGMVGGRSAGGTPVAEVPAPLRAGGDAGTAGRHRGDVSVRSAASDVPERLRGRRADAGDSRPRPQPAFEYFAGTRQGAFAVVRSSCPPASTTS